MQISLLQLPKKFAFRDSTLYKNIYEYYTFIKSKHSYGFNILRISSKSKIYSVLTAHSDFYAPSYKLYVVMQHVTMYKKAREPGE